MLKLYDYLDDKMVQQFEYQYQQTKLQHFASEVMETLDIDDETEIASSISRAILACASLNISIKNNFKKMFRFDGNNMVTDYKISSLATYLIIINCNPMHVHVAKAQLFFAMRK